MSNAIKGLRSLKGLTQEDVAGKIGMTVKTYWKKENNPDLFTISELKKLAELFEVEEGIFFKTKLTISASE